MRLLSLVVLAVLTLSQSVFAGVNTLNTANSGYDVVAYQTENAAKQGTTKYHVYHKGQAYLFSSLENQKLFKANPEKYVPAFGGYCAMGIALGQKFPIDPEAFYVVDGVTYLNINKTVQKRWLEDTKGHIAQANDNWPGLKDLDPTPL